MKIEFVLADSIESLKKSDGDNYIAFKLLSGDGNVLYATNEMGIENVESGCYDVSMTLKDKNDETLPDTDTVIINNMMVMTSVTVSLNDRLSAIITPDPVTQGAPSFAGIPSTDPVTDKGDGKTHVDGDEKPADEAK